MPLTAGHVPLGQEFSGFVAEFADTTSANTTVVTEIVCTSITFTAFAGVRYKVTYTGNAEATIADTAMTLRLRWANSGTPSTAGTEFARCGMAQAVDAAFGHPFTLLGTFTGQSAGAVTISATIQSGGAATVKQNAASSNGDLYFLVEII